MDFPNKKYSIIYADPPWQFRNYGYARTKSGAKAKRGCEKEYPTMSPEQIKSLPVGSIADANSILFMWCVWPLLPEAIEVIRSWEFEYKTVGFVWIKSYEKSGRLFWGMGNWTRSNSEVCLIGLKGKPLRRSASVHQLIQYPVSIHSKKPEIARNKIIELCGDLPRIELFARQKIEDWDAWGNEIGEQENAKTA